MAASYLLLEDGSFVLQEDGASRVLLEENNARVSQDVVEVAAAGSPHARSSQSAVEVLNSGSGHARTSQVAVAVLRQVRPASSIAAGLSQAAVEVLVPVQAVRARASQAVAEVLRQARIFGTGPGNGGERFPIQLAPAGTTVTATLDALLGADDDGLLLTGDSGLPPTGWFCLTVDDEVLYVSRTSPGTYRIDRRGLSNTAVAAHAAGATATWTDTYLMAVLSANDIAKSFVYPVDGNTYDAWLICFDSSQGRLGGNRYPSHVAELVGAYAPLGSTSRLDSGQPSARHTPAVVSDNCPAAITVPAKIVTDIEAGDVVLLRYTNTEASILSLTSRAAAVQSWYAFSRRDALNNVVDSDPTGTVVDASINVEAHDVPETTITLPGADRTYTYGPPRFSDKGWPLAALAVRQDRRRIPHWRSPDWHNFTFVYPGFFDDATYVQVLINRNGYTYAGVLEETVGFPTPLDTDGPNATWDDSSYYFGSSWYVAIFAGATLFVGPSVSGEPGSGVSSSPPIVPAVQPGSSGGGGGGGPGVDPPDPPPLEGGGGGDIAPSPDSGHDRFWISLI